MINDPDLFFAVGIIFGAVAFPALLRAFTHHNGVGAAMVLAALSAGCIGAAVIQKPTGYTVEEAPKVVTSVIARYIN